MLSRWILAALPMAILGAALVAGVASAQKIETVGAVCTGNDGQTRFWEQSSICPSGTLVWQRPAFQFGASTSQTCDSGLAGMVQWTGTAASPNNTLQGCDGTAWRTIVGATTANAFSFTNQTGATPSSTISSDAVTLSGFTGTLTATCGTGCTAIARNGAWGGVSVAGFLSGDTIAIRQTSSASLNTATTANVTVGTTTSGTWTVTTTTNTPSAFSFTDQTGVEIALTITSNAVTLLGFTGTQTASCNSGCTAIAKNGVWLGTTATGFAANDTIAIKQVSSASSNTATTASVTVGGTTSGTWTATTKTDPCAGVSTIGGVCPNGEIYAGITPDTGTRMYATPCDKGMTGTQGACTGSRANTSWNNGTANYTTTGFTNTNTGQANTSGLVALSDAGSPYNAAAYCDGLSANLQTDWYLPASQELAVLYANKTAIGGFDESVTYYWSSTETLTNSARTQRFSDGLQLSGNKNNSYAVRCVRR